MPEQVSNRTLFHVTAVKPYKQAFVANQVIHVGNTDNPFFRFYESVRQYPAIENGQTIQLEAIRWLTAVRDGGTQPPPGLLPRIAVEVAQHYVMLCRELIMEEIRVNEFNSTPPSRQKCLYACDSLERARYWNARIGDNGLICELNCTGTIHHADARLLLGGSEPLSMTRDHARAYWRGDVSDNPEMETLFAGDAVVTGFGL
jgi:hypothetical protein